MEVLIRTQNYWTFNQRAGELELRTRTFPMYETTCHSIIKVRLSCLAVTMEAVVHQLSPSTIQLLTRGRNWEIWYKLALIILEYALSIRFTFMEVRRQLKFAH